MGLLGTLAGAGAAKPKLAEVEPEGVKSAREKLQQRSRGSSHSTLPDDDGERKPPREDTSTDDDDGPQEAPPATAAAVANRWVPKAKNRRRGSFGPLLEAGVLAGLAARRSSGDAADTSPHDREDPPSTKASRRSLARRLSLRSSALSEVEGSGGAHHASSKESAAEARSAQHVPSTPPACTEHPRPIRRSSLVASDDEGSFDELFSPADVEFDSALDASPAEPIPAIRSASLLASMERRPSSCELDRVAAVRAREYVNEVLFREGGEVAIDRERWKDIPQYCKSELTMGKFLGKGSYSDVFEVVAPVEEPDTSKTQDELDRRAEAVRAALDAHVDTTRRGPSSVKANKPQDLPRRGRCKSDLGTRSATSFHLQRRTTQSTRKIQATYAMKCLRPQMRSDGEQFLVGVEDLVHETAMLAGLNHENVIRLHGRAQSANLRLSDGYFILLDRLADTLEDRIGRWRAAAGKRSRGQPPSLPQLKAACSIADALAYLHSKKIVWRDCKPANVGFDSTGVLKLFDFGFAATLKDDGDGWTEPLYEVCGTKRYMAPEVGLIRGYGTPADVHSFGILLWETCALLRPFEKIKTSGEFDRIVFEKGARPKPSKQWSRALREVMSECWSAFPGQRPSMETVKVKLEAEVCEASAMQRRTAGNKEVFRRSMFRRFSQ
ncbi:hypothetical protein ACHAXT_012260 [Thalassiosira profunda]